ncbi:MAG: CoA transferase, partial [Bradymonadaceae bacterium]
TGRGEHLDISMTEGALTFQLPALAAAADDPEQGPGMGILEGEAPAYDVYRTADDEFLAVGALEPKFWSNVVQAIGEPGLIGGGLSQGEEGEEVRQRVAELLATRTRDEWMETFEGEDVCIEPVQSLEEVL